METTTETPVFDEVVADLGYPPIRPTQEGDDQ